jgi:hypothetical protein
MKLVDPLTKYAPEESFLKQTEDQLSAAVFEIIQEVRRQMSEHDEDPEFDADDLLAVITKEAGLGKKLVDHFRKVSLDRALQSSEAIAHGVYRNLVDIEPIPEDAKV